MNVSEQPQTLLTVKEAARLLGQHEDTVRAKIARGEIPAVRIGDTPRARIRIDAREFERWLFEEN